LRERFWAIKLNRENRDFLRKQLHGGEPPIVRALLCRYIKVWEQHANAEPLPHRKDNAACRAANLWLLDEIDRLRTGDTETVETYTEHNAAGIDAYKSCRTCEHYRSDRNHCVVYQATPPDEYVNEAPNDCEQWEDEIPF